MSKTNHLPARTEPPAAPQKSVQNSVLMRLAAQYGVTETVLLDVVKKTIMPGAVTNEDLVAFLLVADRYKLNPLTKEIYAFPRKGGGITPIVGADGWYRLANDHHQFDGYSQKVVRDEEFGVGIETTLHRKDRTHPAVHVEWLNECRRSTDPWKMPMRMLGHKSFIQCARKAFSLAGIYDEDEAERIGAAQVLVPSPAPRGVAGLAKQLDAPAPEFADSADESSPSDESEGPGYSPDADDPGDSP